MNAKQQVKAWMVQNAKDCVDRSWNELNTTQLAQYAAHHFGHDEWLDDETHYVWECALEVEKLELAWVDHSGIRAR